jgi:hypothetical protein
MSLQDRIESLRAKHAALDTAIEVESRRPLPNSVHIKDLKLQKLRIKEELNRMNTSTH